MLIVNFCRLPTVYLLGLLQVYLFQINTHTQSTVHVGGDFRLF